NSSAPTEPSKKEEKSDDLQELKAQIAAMQRKLDTMS
ncbi:polyhydroxyalkanoate synthesis repressor PhaR, partial [Mesorhizobium sp. M2E.F.Ca.ET.154.01.1.1]